MGLAARIYDATWGRGFAAVYDRGLKATEDAGLREIRREVLAGASGRTIDIGAGTGVNIELFPSQVTELVLAEPDPHMAAKLRPKLRASSVEAEVIEAPAEQLSFESSSFDTAVFTLVLWTVPDPAAALAEAARILRPEGAAVFVTPNRLTFARPDEIIDPYHYVEYDPAQLRELCEVHFGSVELHGIFGSQRYSQLIAEQLARLDRLLRRDPLRLRRLIPRRLRQRLYDRRLASERSEPDPRAAAITVDDFELRADALDKAHDLVAVCHAPGRG